MEVECVLTIAAYPHKLAAITQCLHSLNQADRYFLLRAGKDQNTSLFCIHADEIRRLHVFMIDQYVVQASPSGILV